MTTHRPRATEREMIHGRRAVRPHLRSGSVAAAPHPRRHLSFAAAPVPVVG
jgi:hypothetical protein